MGTVYFGLEFSVNLKWLKKNKAHFISLSPNYLCNPFKVQQIWSLTSNCGQDFKNQIGEVVKIKLNNRSKG